MKKQKKEKKEKKEKINLCKYCGKPAAVQHPRCLKDMYLVDKCYACFLIYSDAVADAAIVMYDSPKNNIEKIMKDDKQKKKQS